ncbi:hypothetical protein [Intrasporangium sp.]|uniref:hypothetical protein n=1 Tax=Intrasporangium sp. TaxID=1925024 RepID=UPI003221B195
MCDNGSCRLNRADPRDRPADLDLTLLEAALAHVSAHPLEWDQAVAPGHESLALGGTTRSFLGHVLSFGGIEAPAPARSTGSVWLDSADTLATVCRLSGACEHDLEVLVHPRARVDDLARAVDWIRVGLPTEPVIDEIEDREPGARVEPVAAGGAVTRLLSSGPEAPDLAADLAGDPSRELFDQLVGLEPAAWFGRSGAPDLRLLEQALAFVVEHPLQWDQRTWQSEGLFGPVRCLAGHALVLSDYAIDALDVEQAVSPDGIVGTTTRHAAARLGLTEAQATQLFALNDLDTLRALVRRIGTRSAAVPRDEPD